MGSGLLSVEVCVSLGVEDILLCFLHEEVVGGEEGCIIVIHLCDVRRATTLVMLASRLRAILRPVTGMMAVEACVVVVCLAFADGATNLLSLLVDATVAMLALGLMLFAAAQTSALLLGRAGAVSALLLILSSKALLLS